MRCYTNDIRDGRVRMAGRFWEEQPQSEGVFAGPTLIHMIWGRNRHHLGRWDEKKGMRCSAAPGTLERRQVDHWYLYVWLWRAEHEAQPVAIT